MTLDRTLSAMRTFGFVYLSAVVTVVFSERVFWFWSPQLVPHLEGALFYSVPMAAVVWAIAWFRVSTAWALLLATPLYAYVVEGVITPVLYSGGPFVPFFPAWFAAWHGVGAVFLLWYCLRRWLVAGAWKAIAGLGAGLGVFWGVWASTLRLPGEVNDPDMVADLGELTVLGPRGFALHTLLITTVLIAGHLGLDRIWPTHWAVGKRSTYVFTISQVALAGAWTVAAPWALPMFVAYGYLQVRYLRRHRDVSKGPNLIEQLAGRISVIHLAPLLLIVPTASLTYLAIWRIDPSDLALSVIYFGVVCVQTVLGATLSVMAWRRARRSATSSDEPGCQAELQHDRRAMRRIRA